MADYLDSLDAFGVIGYVKTYNLTLCDPRLGTYKAFSVLNQNHVIRGAGVELYLPDP